MWGSGCKLGGGDCGSLEAFGDGTGKHRGPIWAHLRRGHVSRLKNMKQEKRPNGSWAWTPRVNSGIPSPCQEEFECIFINLKFLQNDFSLPPSKTFSSYQLQPKSLFCPRLLLALLLKTEEKRTGKPKWHFPVQICKNASPPQQSPGPHRSSNWQALRAAYC